MNGPSETQPSAHERRRFTLKRREKWSLLLLMLAVLSGVLLWRPVNQAVLTALVLRAERPAATVVVELVAHAKDPAILLERLWRTDRIPQRLSALAYLKEHARNDGALVERLQPVVLAAAEDGDFEVKELAFDTLAARGHPELRRLAQEQLRDVDPAVRMLALIHLRKAGDAKLVPAVVPLLDDPNPLVVVHAAQALRYWTREDFGVRVSQAPVPFRFNQEHFENSSQADELKQGVQRWKNWWKLHENDYPAAAIPSSKAMSSWRIPAPEFALPDLDGNRLSLSAFKGKAVLVNFWDTLTTNCLAEIANLNELRRKYSKRLVVLAISLDSIANECGCGPKHNHSSPPKPDLSTIRAQVKQVATDRGIEYSVLIDPTGSVGRRFIGDDRPTYILIDADGNIRRRFLGGRTLATLEAMIKEVTALTEAK